MERINITYNKKILLRISVKSEHFNNNPQQPLYMKQRNFLQQKLFFFTPEWFIPKRQFDSQKPILRTTIKILNDTTKK